MRTVDRLLGGWLFLAPVQPVADWTCRRHQQAGNDIASPTRTWTTAPQQQGSCSWICRVTRWAAVQFTRSTAGGTCQYSDAVMVLGSGAVMLELST